MVYPSTTIQRLLVKAGEVVSRRKTEDRDEGDTGKSELARVLGIFDLTLLGVGSTLGVGVYVLAGAVARSDAGPAVTLSFLVAAIASAFAGVCYAEFAARVPKAGSAYVYSYVTVGELAAFVIGWNLILEYVIGTASVARAFSSYLDNLFDKAMAHALEEAMPLNVSFLSKYPDFLSLGIVLLLTVLLAWGVKESALMNNIFTAVNLITVATVIIAGLFKVDSHNWAWKKEEIPEGPDVHGGEGGFMPFGVSGVMAGAAKCFFGFVGFDCVATTGEEAKNPQRHIPLAIVISLLVIFFSYFGISAVITLMVPYFHQDPDAPLVKAFQDAGMPVISYIVSAGAIFALCTSLLGCVLPLPRVLYAMGVDGLLPSFFAQIYPKTQTPLLGTLSSGVFAGIMAAIFDLEQLINMMSIGTLLAYTIVALCVLLLRYRDPKPPMYEPKDHTEVPVAWSDYLGQIVNRNRLLYPDKVTTTVAEVAIGVFVVLAFITTLWIVNIEARMTGEMVWEIYILIGLLLLTCVPVIVIFLQPQETPSVFFKVPCLPLLPCLSIFINIYLMMKLDVNTWVRFIVWLALGGLIYIFYSIPNSIEGKKNKQRSQVRVEKLNMSTR